MKMMLKYLTTLLLILAMATPAFAGKKDPLAAWKPAFDPSGAKYKYILSNVSHPAIEGIAVGYRIRDKVWEKTGGRLYVDFRPLAQLGGEKDVIRKLKLGAVQGMLCSSVAAANVADKLGIVNLPYVVDTFDKLDTFRTTPELWQPFANSPQKAGLQVVDITGYGTYGWATNTPVKNLADAKKVNFRIAQAPVNKDSYEAWGLKFTVMPWPDVPQALQTGVIDGLDHTPIVCNITKKFEIAKNFTQLDYAQGLFIHLMNKRWLNKLPKDLQAILLETIAEESAVARDLTRKQQADQIAKAKAAGVQFFTLNAEEKQLLIQQAQPVYDSWSQKIGEGYLKQVQATLSK